MSDRRALGVWRVLAIDDEAESLDLIKEVLEAEPLADSGSVEVIQENNFDAALELLERHRIDLVVLDIRLGTGPGADIEAGPRTRNAVHRVRFVPIVFYTGLPNYADSDDDNPFVEVVTKGSSLQDLRQCVDRLLASGAPQVQRALIVKMEEVIRNFMLGYVAPQWADKFEGEPGKANLAHILARRLSVALTGTELSKVIKGLGYQVSSDAVTPLRYYLVPPVGATPMVGDLHEISHKDHKLELGSWWVVLTPTCDHVQGKADFVLLAKCNLLEDMQVHKNVAQHSNPSTSQEDKLKAILRNSQSPRYYYLPAAFNIPHLNVDFQDLHTISSKDLNAMKPAASLDSPFAEELQSRFAAYYGRIGSPDLDWTPIFNAIRGQV